MAHELAHIKNRDTLTMAVAATIGGAISMFALYLQLGMLFGGNRDNGNGPGFLASLVAMLIAPFAAMLVQMAISRSREYQADRIGCDDLRQSDVAGLCIGQDPRCGSAHAELAGRAHPRRSTSVHHQSADRARLSTICFRPTPTWKTAFVRSRNWPWRWGKPQPRLTPIPASQMRRLQRPQGLGRVEGPRAVRGVDDPPASEQH